ncbi:hypothetical protein [Clostridium thailandense]|uniref:Uncharacterized protein n=1 Tax=Clostridium thailandense TaxID=2794346 RepID=A0A949TUK3_9CLOT|nr:hypothetical protein [Clostridium thailandense]MBV7271675.1 hypothetical protein [Clostridium thailandense]MCH5136354.1 hypothetical protein [Clostridiaceae bacterium UIB06]
MEQYRGYEITVIENNEKDYPYKAIATKGDQQVKHKGQTKTQAVDFVKKSINVIIEKIEAKNSVKSGVK